MEAAGGKAGPDDAWLFRPAVRRRLQSRGRGLERTWQSRDLQCRTAAEASAHVYFAMYAPR
jgi:hypothetical protein